MTKPKTYTKKNSQTTRQTKNQDKKRWYFPAACLFLLLASVAWWSYWGAKVQQGNADQLVNAQLFESRSVLRDATVPATHSFLIKWPLFWLIHVLHQTSAAYTAITVLLSITTVAGFAWLLYKLQPKPTRLGLLYLALASCLLLVPAAPYSGGILPVNMAMVANRNIEYLFYLEVLWLVAGQPSWKSKKFIVAVAGLTLLVASDRLFLYFAVISSVLGLFAGWLLHKPEILSAAKRLVAASLLSIASTTALIAALAHTHIANIASTGASPYGLVGSVHQLLLNTFYAGNGLLTNFGANPMFDAQVVRAAPTLAVQRLVSPYGIAFVVNVVIFLACVAAVASVIKAVVIRTKKQPALDHSTVFVLMLVASSCAAFATFIGSDHYAFVDARYLTITLFALFEALAIMSGTFRLTIVRLRFVFITLLLSILCGLIGAKALAQGQQQALLNIKGRNETISAALKQSPDYKLVGDYWRVVPIKDQSPTETSIVPMSDCVTPGSILSSKAWSKDFEKHPFIYLLSLDKSLTNFPHCDSTAITRKYGQPNRSLIISGTPSNPQEMLLFYDTGVRLASGTGVIPNTSLSTDDLPLTNSACGSGKTILQIIAHEDDDLLFMNPALQTNIDQGDCIRTIYLTAGDSGQDRFYWLSREQGSKAAYSSMFKTTTPWVEKPLSLQGGAQVNVAELETTNRVSLVFFKLPDGNLLGQGFLHTQSASLAKLYQDQQSRLSTVDGLGSFSRGELVTGLAHIMDLVKPDVIRTQSTELSREVHEHSDHIAAGHFALLATELYTSRLPEQSKKPAMEFYQGYPVRERPSNVSGESLSRKLAVFEIYTRFDDAACNPKTGCWKKSNYSRYVSRQYLMPH